MHRYAFSPEVYVEQFDDDAILLLANRDLMLTVNLAASQLYQAARAVLGDQTFSRCDCTAFLIENYDLPSAEARRQTRVLLACGLRHRILVKGGPH